MQFCSLSVNFVSVIPIRCVCRVLFSNFRHAPSIVLMPFWLERKREWERQRERERERQSERETERERDTVRRREAEKEKLLFCFMFSQTTFRSCFPRCCVCAIVTLTTVFDVPWLFWQPLYSLTTVYSKHPRMLAFAFIYVCVWGGWCCL